MKVLVVSGASGGHIFPALSFIDALHQADPKAQILFVLPERSLKVEPLPRSCRLSYICLSSISPKLSLKAFREIARFLKGSFESLFLVLEFKPDIIVGFGSISSIPIVISGWLFRIKTLIHEQNVVPGRANRFLSKLVDKVTVSFQESERYLKINKQRLCLTGNPLRKQLENADKDKALDFFKFERGKFTILVMGGSQGSRKINHCFSEALSKITQREKLQIIHISGLADFDFLDKNYRDLNCKVRLFGFLEEIGHAYSASHLVISRAGATTVAELLHFRLPAIIIPYPYASGHQLYNAGALEKSGRCVIIEEDKLNADKLRQAIEGFIDHPAKTKGMGSGFETDAAKLLVEEAVSLLESSEKV